MRKLKKKNENNFIKASNFS